MAGTWGTVHTLFVNGAVNSTNNVTRRLENNAQIEFGGGYIEQIVANRYFNGRMDEIPDIIDYPDPINGLQQNTTIKMHRAPL